MTDSSEKALKSDSGTVDKGVGNETKTTTPINNDRYQLLSTLFFGLLNQFDDRYVSNSNIDPSKISSTSKEQLYVNSKQQQDKTGADNGTNNDSISLSVQDTSNESNINGVLDQIDRWIPHDPIALRQTSIFKGALQLLQGQRDGYLVGNEYAEWRKNDRIRQQQWHQKYYLYRVSTPADKYNIPYNSTTISHHHISSLAGDFIPTPTVRNLLIPIVTGLFEKDTGVLYEPIKQSTINIIMDQQQNLQTTMKNQILLLLDNPRNRDAIKDSTQGIIIKTARIDSDVHSSAK